MYAVVLFSLPLGDPTKAATTADSSKENELRKQKQNFILEQALRDATASAERVVVDAASELENAAERTEEYASKLMRALDEAAGKSLYKGEVHWLCCNFRVFFVVIYAC